MILSLFGLEHIVLVIACLLICFGAMGCVLPPSTMLALEPHGAIAGVASALMGTLQFAFGATSSAIVSALFNGTSLPFLATLAACGTGAFLLSRVTLGGTPHHEDDPCIAMAPEEQVL